MDAWALLSVFGHGWLSLAVVHWVVSRFHAQLSFSGRIAHKNFWRLVQGEALFIVTVQETCEWSSTFWRLLLLQAGSFWCFHDPPNCGMDHRIFNMRMVLLLLFFLACENTRGTSVYRLTRRTSCRVCTDLDSGEISGRAQSLAQNGGPCVWWPHSIVLNMAFESEFVFFFFF